MSATLAAPLRARDRLLPPARQRRSMANEGWLSLTLHLLVLALLIVRLARQHLQDVTEPGTVAVVFEGGPKATTKQTEESRHSQPTTAPNPHETEEQPPGATAAARPARPLPPPSPPAAAETPPAEHAAPPAPALQAPTGPSPVKLPQSAPARPVPQRPPEQQRAPAPANPFSSLRAPMEFSLQGHPPPPASAGHLKRGINLAMAPNDHNSNIMTRYAEARRKLGEDWWAEFTEYVEEHKYYPLSAAEKGEDGQSVLKLTIARDGTVLDVHILISSGSTRLDDAWISEFRGQKVPAFPPGTEEDKITFPASMDYILLHQ